MKLGNAGNDFEKLFMEAVDEGLRFLCESGRQMVFFHLERSYSIKRQDIPRKLEAFAEELEKIFSAGAVVIEKLILERLSSKLGSKYEEKERKPPYDRQEVGRQKRNPCKRQTGNPKKCWGLPSGLPSWSEKFLKLKFMKKMVLHGERLQNVKPHS